MKYKTIDLYYYSGTGNTLLIVNEITKVFKNNSFNIQLKKIEKYKPETFNPNNTIGLAFPVAFQSTFPFIWDFIHSLPETQGTEIFMVDTLMSFSGAIVGPLKKALTKKGYSCIGAKEIVMPSNWLPKKIDKDKNEKIISKGLNSAREYAIKLINGKTKWRRIPILSDLFYKLCCNKFMMKNINTAPGKKIMVDKIKCVGCGLCAKICPVKNISFETKPNWSDKCVICMRCLTFCPKGAIYIKGKTFIPYKAISVKELRLSAGGTTHEKS